MGRATCPGTSSPRGTGVFEKPTAVRRDAVSVGGRPDPGGRASPPNKRVGYLDGEAVTDRQRNGVGRVYMDSGGRPAAIDLDEPGEAAVLAADETNGDRRPLGDVHRGVKRARDRGISGADEGTRLFR